MTPRNAGGEGARRPSAVRPVWPVLADEAYYGLAGEIVRAADPHTEADPVAVLTSLLAACGSAMGRGAYMRVGTDTHYLRLFVGLVGRSAKARKGMSWSLVRDLLKAVDETWTKERVYSGLSTGEGLIYHVRDRIEDENAKGEVTVLDPGVADKRLFVLEPELASVLKQTRREGNTISPVIRQAWDDGEMRVMTRNNPMRATGAHVSIVGHITDQELVQQLNETEAANGFANRFVWIRVRRSKVLPFGGQWHEVDTAPLVDRICSALDFGRRDVEIRWGQSAKAAWSEVYGPLSEGKPGLFGAVVGRAEAQVVRLAALYAVLDESTVIERNHLFAGLAVWAYAEESARQIFRGTGNPLADQILNALKASGRAGMTRTEISHALGRNKTANRISEALALLHDVGLARSTSDVTAGRAAERWFAR